MLRATLERVAALCCAKTSATDFRTGVIIDLKLRPPEKADLLTRPTYMASQLIDSVLFGSKLPSSSIPLVIGILHSL